MTTPAISITKVPTPTTVSPGGTVTYNYVVTAGTAALTGVTIVDTLPTGLTFVSSNPLPTPNPPVGGTAIIPLGALAAAASATASLTASVSALAAAGPLTNTATVTATVVGGGTVSATTTATVTVVTSADLSVTKCGPRCAEKCDKLVYEVIVRNLGPNAASTVQLNDIFSGSHVELLSLTQVSGTTPWIVVGGTASIATLPAGSISIFRVKARARKAGCVTNTVTVSSLTPDPNPFNNTATVTTKIRENDKEKRAKH